MSTFVVSFAYLDTIVQCIDCTFVNVICAPQMCRTCIYGPHLIVIPALLDIQTSSCNMV